MRVYTDPAAKLLKPKDRRKMLRLLAKRLAHAEAKLARQVARSIYPKD